MVHKCLGVAHCRMLHVWETVFNIWFPIRQAKYQITLCVCLMLTCAPWSELGRLYRSVREANLMVSRETWAFWVGRGGVAGDVWLLSGYKLGFLYISQIQLYMYFQMHEHIFRVTVNIHMKNHARLPQSLKYSDMMYMFFAPKQVGDPMCSSQYALTMTWWDQLFHFHCKVTLLCMVALHRGANFMLENPLQSLAPALHTTAFHSCKSQKRSTAETGSQIWDWNKCLNESMVEPILPDLLPPTASQVPQEARPHGTNDLAWNVWCQDLEAC